MVPDVVQRWRQQHGGIANGDYNGDGGSSRRRGVEVPGFLKPASRRWHATLSFISRELNFYRIHVLVFVFTPLIMAAIFYASNGENHIPFIDCLFVCVSAMTVTGLVTFNISTATAWQQAILFILMLLGNISAVSVTMIWVRRHFFRKKFDDAIRNNAAARKRAKDIEEAHHLQRRMGVIRLKQAFGLGRHGKNDDEDTDSIEMNGNSQTSSTDRQAEAEIKAQKKRKHPHHKGKLRTDMIRRVDQPAMLVNPMGLPSEGHPAQQGPGAGAGGGAGGILTNAERRSIEEDSAQQPSVRITEPDGREQQPEEEEQPRDSNPLALHRTGRIGEDDEEEAEEAIDDASEVPSVPAPSSPNVASPRTRFHDIDPPSMRRRRGSDPSGADRHHARRGSQPAPLHLPPSAAGMDWRPSEDRFPRSQTVEFAEPPRPGTGGSHNHERTPRHANTTANGDRTSGYTTGVFPKVPTSSGTLPRQRTFERTMTGVSSRRGIPITRTITTSAKDRGFGGFPTPIDLAGRGIKAVLPGVREKVMRSTTMPRTSTIASTHSMTRVGTAVGGDGKSAPYLSFDVAVYGNSMFHSLTEAQREELGGVEYRALDMLAKIVPAYWFCVQMFMVVLVAPYLASSAFNKYRPVFESQGKYAPDTTWFWFFQVTSAYSNTGMSLIDTSMSNMADAYFLLIPMGILILVGNTAFPIFLRFCIWTYSKCVPKASRTYETLRFILDHPRRCFVYLFPSGQTWFLLFIVFVLTMTDWVFFEILDIGNPEIEDIAVPQRIFDGLFQSIAVRAAGFQIISLLSLAPAVQFLYVVMMYISAYPIALSVRSTNVYEERSLGVYTEKGTDGEEAELPDEVTSQGWGTYLAAHARRQLAFDIWWLGFSLWLLCIVERGNIQDPASNGWFTVFSCLFELTSAYGTVGLSTGTPYDAFSLSGRFNTLGKLIVCMVMLRGRHRGLPVAIDRSIMLPKELDDQDAVDEAWSVVEATALREREQMFSRIATTSIGRGGIIEGDEAAEIDSDDKAASLVAGGNGSVGGGSSPDSSGSGSGSGNGGPAPPYVSHHRLSRTVSPGSLATPPPPPPASAFGLDAIEEKQQQRTPMSEEEEADLSRAPSSSSKGKERAAEEEDKEQEGQQQQQQPQGPLRRRTSSHDPHLVGEDQ